MPPDNPRSEVIPPVLSTVEGVVKILLGTAAGLLLLYMAYVTFETGGTLNTNLVYLLAAFMIAFLGVDVLSIIRRVQGRR